MASIRYYHEPIFRSNLNDLILDSHNQISLNLSQSDVDSDESEKIKRGWIKTKYDESIYETELDNYKDFDKIIINNESIDNLSVKIIEFL